MLAATQEPITGHETLTDARDPHSALSQFYHAFNTRDIELMELNWDSSDEVAMDNPLGGIKRGWPEIRAVYQRIFSSEARVQVEFYDYTLQSYGDVFIAVGRERGKLFRDGNTLELAIRTSRIFRWTDSRWRQVHHHGSIDDPQLLARYQQAVR